MCCFKIKDTNELMNKSTSIIANMCTGMTNVLVFTPALALISSPASGDQ